MIDRAKLHTRAPFLAIPGDVVQNVHIVSEAFNDPAVAADTHHVLRRMCLPGTTKPDPDRIITQAAWLAVSGDGTSTDTTIKGVDHTGIRSMIAWRDGGEHAIVGGVAYSQLQVKGTAIPPERISERLEEAISFSRLSKLLSGEISSPLDFDEEQITLFDSKYRGEGMIIQQLAERDRRGSLERAQADMRVGFPVAVVTYDQEKLAKYVAEHRDMFHSRYPLDRIISQKLKDAPAQLVRLNTERTYGLTYNARRGVNTPDRQIQRAGNIYSSEINYAGNQEAWREKYGMEQGINEALFALLATIKPGEPISSEILKQILFLEIYLGGWNYARDTFVSLEKHQGTEPVHNAGSQVQDFGWGGQLNDFEDLPVSLPDSPQALISYSQENVATRATMLIGDFERTWNLSFTPEDTQFYQATASTGFQKGLEGTPWQI